MHKRTDDDWDAIGRNCEARRHQLGLSRKGLAILAGCCVATIVKLERLPGHRKGLSEHMLARIVRVLEGKTAVVAETPAMDLPGQFRQMRVSRGLSQAELARLSGCSPATINAVEGLRGNISKMRCTTLAKIAKAMGFKLSFELVERN
jgi:DNA-binding XRE family transcriptional regulator